MRLEMKSLGLIMMITVLTVACSSTPTKTVAAKPVVKPVAKPVDPEFNADIIARGYEPVKRNGKVLYCRPRRMTGSHFDHKVCLTEPEVAQQDQNTDQQAREMDRMRHGACGSASSC